MVIKLAQAPFEVWKGQAIYHDSFSGLFWTPKSDYESYILSDVRVYATCSYFWR